jgi:hypothetical protein
VSLLERLRAVASGKPADGPRWSSEPIMTVTTGGEMVNNLFNNRPVLA